MPRGTFAIDATTGWLWLCFYDTAGDPQRIEARYVCTASQDGGQHFAAAVAGGVVEAEPEPAGRRVDGGGGEEVVAHPGGGVDRTRSVPERSEVGREDRQEDVLVAVGAGRGRVGEVDAAFELSR
jgi:hypothetical protein